MQEWSESINIALDVIIGCILITALLVVIGLGQSIMRLVDTQNAATANVREYRIAAAYEGTTVYPQDIIALVLENQGIPYVKVLNNTLGTKTWSMSSASTIYTSSEVSKVISKTGMFKCTLDYNENGMLEGYIFDEI